MESTLSQIENRLREINHRFHTRIILEKSNGKYTFYWCDSNGLILLTLNLSTDCRYREVSDVLRLLSNLFI